MPPCYSKAKRGPRGARGATGAPHAPHAARAVRRHAEYVLCTGPCTAACNGKLAPATVSGSGGHSFDEPHALAPGAVSPRRRFCAAAAATGSLASPIPQAPTRPHHRIHISKPQAETIHATAQTARATPRHSHDAGSSQRRVQQSSGAGMPQGSCRRRASGRSDSPSPPSPGGSCSGQGVAPCSTSGIGLHRIAVQAYLWGCRQRPSPAPIVWRARTHARVWRGATPTRRLDRPRHACRCRR